MTTGRQLTRAEILALPPSSTLDDLAGALGVSDPTVRQLNRSGELERMGIRVVRLGAQFRVITSTVWDFLGISPADGAGTVPAPTNGPGQRGPTASALRPVGRRDGAA